MWFQSVPVLPAAIRSAIQSLTDDVGWKAAFAIIASIINYLIGTDTSLVGVLVVFVGIDYVSGVYAAYERSDLSASQGLRGIIKKLLLFSVPVMGNLLDQQLGISASRISLREMVLWMAIANEGLSVLENLVDAGVIVEDRIPDQLRGVLLHLAKRDREVERE